LSKSFKDAIELYALFKKEKIHGLLEQIAQGSKDRFAKKKKLKTFRSLFLLYFMIYFCIGILPGNIDNLLITLPQTTKMGIGIVITSSLISGMVSLLLFGYYGEKVCYNISRKKLFIFTNLVWIMGYGLFSFSLNYTFLVIFAIISAVGTGAFLPVGFSIISDLFPPKERGKKFGLMQFGFLLGNGVGIIFGSVFGSLFNFNGWRFAYGLSFILSFFALLSYIRGGLDPERGTSEPEFEDLQGKLNYNYKITSAAILQLFRIKSVIAIFVSVLCSGVAISTLGNWAIFYLTAKINSNNSEVLATIIYLLVGLGGLPGTIIGGKIADSSLQSGTIRGRVIISFIGLVSGISLLMAFYLIPFFTWTPMLVVVSWVLFIPIGFFGYCFAYFSVGNQFAIYSEVCVPEVRNTANAMNGLMINIGGIFGNLMISSLIEKDVSLLPFAIFIVLIIWLLGSFLWIIPYFHYPSEVIKCRKILEKRRSELVHQFKSYLP